MKNSKFFQALLFIMLGCMFLGLNMTNKANNVRLNANFADVDCALEDIQAENAKLRAQLEESNKMLSELQEDVSFIKEKIAMASEIQIVTEDPPRVTTKYDSLHVGEITKWNEELVPKSWSNIIKCIWVHNDETIYNDTKVEIFDWLKNGAYGLMYFNSNDTKRIRDNMENAAILFRADIDSSALKSLYTECIENHVQLSWPHLVIVAEAGSDLTDMINNFTNTCCTAGASIRIIYTDGTVQDFEYYVE